MSTNAILPGIRILPAEVPVPVAAPATSAGFDDVLDVVVRNLDQQQSAAAAKVTDLMSGNGADLPDALIAVEKADLQFQLMVQVRNKVVQAYQQIAGMQF